MSIKQKHKTKNSQKQKQSQKTNVVQKVHIHLDQKHKKRHKRTKKHHHPSNVDVSPPMAATGGMPITMGYAQPSTSVAVPTQQNIQPADPNSLSNYFSNAASVALQTSLMQHLQRRENIGTNSQHSGNHQIRQLGFRGGANHDAQMNEQLQRGGHNVGMNV
jgi:hypothetical protein